MPERTRFIEASLSTRRIQLRPLFPLSRSCRKRREAASLRQFAFFRQWAERIVCVNMARSASAKPPELQCGRRATIALGAMALLVSAAGPAFAAGCSFEPQGEGRVADVIDARSFRLQDGREVRLAGIEPVVPEQPSSEKPSSEKPSSAKPSLEKPSANRTPALAAILTGRAVKLRGEDDTPDRYGRQPAFVFLDPSETLVQGELLAQGEALVSATSTDKECASVLMAAEALAREAKRGVWGDPAAIKNSESPGDILAGIGRFTLVEGKVLSVRQAGATTYLNFGRNWTRDFAVTISRRVLPVFAAAGIVPKSLENRRIRVRGFVEARGGPRIELLRVGQIELLGGN
jgi:endonuclease YncB( thermonuclease family)